MYLRKVLVNCKSVAQIIKERESLEAPLVELDSFNKPPQSR